MPTRFLRRVLWLGVLGLFALPISYAQPITSSASLIEAMHNRYANDWYSTLTFVQETITLRPDAAPDTAIWYEAMVPGQLRIDFAPWEAGNGMYIGGGQQHSIRNNAVVRSRPNSPVKAIVNDFVYLQPPSRTLAQLDSLGYDLSLFYKTVFEDQRMYVIGAAAGDTTTPQIWINAADLYAVRFIQAVGQNGERTLETRYGDFKRLPRGWTETRVDFFLDGRLFQLEYYRDVRSDVPLPEGLFDVENWKIDAPYWE